MTAMSRVLLGRHHVLDVAVGVIIGVAGYYAWSHFYWVCDDDGAGNDDDDVDGGGDDW